MLTKRAFMLTLAAVAAAKPLAGHADVYPSRTVRLVIPFGSGTTSEPIVRLIAERLSIKFGQPVIVENRPGAGGTLGAAAVAAAQPDGYTLLVTPPGPLVTAGSLYKNLKYDPGASFTPVALLLRSPQLLAVNATFPANTLQDLVAYAVRMPGQISFASPGHGTQPHLLGELFKAEAGIQVTHVPYKTPAAGITDLLAGHVQMYFENALAVLPHAESGKLKVLAVAGEFRIPALSDVPTTGECGYPAVVGGYWSGLVAPARTPAAIIETLNRAVNDIMASPEGRASLAQIRAETQLGTPQDLAALIAAETRKWSALIKAAGISID